MDKGTKAGDKSTTPVKKGRPKAKASESANKKDKPAKPVARKEKKSAHKEETKQKSKSKEETKKRSKSKASRKSVAKDSKEDKDGKKKKMKKEKDPTRPKKPAGAYIQYTTEQIPLLKQRPEYKGDGPKFGFKIVDGVEMKHTDFMGIAAANWGKLTPEEKAKYEKRAE